MAKRVRVLLVCFILLILAGLLRIQLSYEDTSDHQGRGPPSVLVKGDSKKLAADQIEKRYTTTTCMYMYCTLATCMYCIHVLLKKICHVI